MYSRVPTEFGAQRTACQGENGESLLILTLQRSSTGAGQSALYQIVWAEYLGDRDDFQDNKEAYSCRIMHAIRIMRAHRSRALHSGNDCTIGIFRAAARAEQEYVFGSCAR